VASIASISTHFNVFLVAVGSLDSSEALFENVHLVGSLPSFPNESNDSSSNKYNDATIHVYKFPIKLNIAIAIIMTTTSTYSLS